MFIHTNQPLITSFYIKKVLIFCRISDESALIRNFLRNGRVRVKEFFNLFFSKMGLQMNLTIKNKTSCSTVAMPIALELIKSVFFPSTG